MKNKIKSIIVQIWCIGFVNVDNRICLHYKNVQHVELLEFLVFSIFSI